MVMSIFSSNIVTLSFHNFWLSERHLLICRERGRGRGEAGRGEGGREGGGGGREGGREGGRGEGGREGGRT